MSFEDDKKYKYRNLSGNTAIEITEDFKYYVNEIYINKLFLVLFTVLSG